MADNQIKLAVFVFIVSAISIDAHDSRGDPDTSSSESSSNEVDRAEISRRSQAHEWQYEGLPIEFPSRRMSSVVTTPATSRAYPPLDPRFRRIYSPDETATIAEYPFMAALLVNKQLWCGAVVIDSDRVLTAAHCLQLQYNNRFFREYVRMLTVRVGSTNASAGGEVLRVTEIFFHPNYKPETLEFNAAVLKLHKNMSLGAKEPRVEKLDYSMDRKIAIDKEITFLGWGSVLGVGGTGGQVLLQKLKLPVYDLADCQEIYGKELVTGNNFCAGYITRAKNVCNHDAGGPAIMDGVLTGILSFSSKRCDTPDQPAVFTTAGAIAPWITDISEKEPAVKLRGARV